MLPRYSGHGELDQLDELALVALDLQFGFLFMPSGLAAMLIMPARVCAHLLHRRLLLSDEPVQFRLAAPAALS